MTASLMTTKDPRMLAETIADVEHKVLIELFNVILASRERLEQNFKWPAMTKKSAVRAFETFLLDCLDGIDDGVIISFPTPKPYSRPAVTVSRLWAEKYDRCREALFTDLVSKFERYVSGEECVR